MINNNIKLLISCVAASVLLAACSMDLDRAGSAFYDLGNNLNNAVEGEEDEEDEEPAETAAPTETAETSEETEPSETDPVPTATPAPTSTPVPTATPAPERVDLSELTEDTISDGITVEDEAFEEHYVDGSDTTVASFSGNRILVQIADAPNVQTSVNLLLDGFYQEAAGLYARYTNEALSEVALEGGTVVLPSDDEEQDEDTQETEETEETEDAVLSSDGTFVPYTVTVSYDHSTNGRVLSVIMSYSVTRGDEFVDIVGRDNYAALQYPLMKEFKLLQKNYPNKMITLAECGSGDEVKMSLLSRIWEQGSRWSWFMTWYDYDYNAEQRGA